MILLRSYRNDSHFGEGTSEFGENRQVSVQLDAADASDAERKE